MEVKLIAGTTIFDEGHAFEEWMSTPDDDSATDADYLAEFAGRSCYQSFSRPRASTRANADYVGNIVRQQHFSVLEHASATFYVTGVSRALTHELIRHRHLSYSQLSQRYVAYDPMNSVIPPALAPYFQEDHSSPVLDLWYKSLATANEAYNEAVSFLENEGKTRKEAREAARAILPNMTETRIVVTGNLRAWRDMLQKRYSVHADAEIREFATLILEHLRWFAPNSFADMPKEPYGTTEV